jgi:HEAT repeat protein
MIELQACIDKLTSEDEADRIYAAEDIGYANRPEGVMPLLARLPMETSRAAREAMFSALNQIEDDSVIEGAIGLLDSEDSFLRNQSVVILRSRGSRAVPFLERAFREGDQDRRKFVLDVLARLGDTDASAIYALALTDDDINVRITAVETLGVMRQSSFRRDIEAMVSPQASPMLLGACIESLAYIGDASSVAHVRTQLVETRHLPDYLEASYIRLLGAQGDRDAMAEVAGFIGNDGLDSQILNALTSLRSRFRDARVPQSIAQPLEDILKAEVSPLLAYQAVRLLGGLLENDDVFHFMCGCLENLDKAVRIAAVQALREAGSGRTEEILRQRLTSETDDEVLQAMKR